jgi:hypothetical protein
MGYPAAAGSRSAATTLVTARRTHFDHCHWVLRRRAWPHTSMGQATDYPGRKRGVDALSSQMRAATHRTRKSSGTGTGFE